MARSKSFKTFDEQVALLQSRGMLISNHADAACQLEKINYYRLSGYWYNYRVIHGGTREDKFVEGTSFDEILSLYFFDKKLRDAVFVCIGDIEIAFRTLLAHYLGEIDPLIHYYPSKLNVSEMKQRESYDRWKVKYNADIFKSKETFINHYSKKYDGKLPIWVAVEVLTWGELAYLYEFSPVTTRKAIAEALGVTDKQLKSWLRSLNLVRNIVAHHGRLFNRKLSLIPIISTNVPEIAECCSEENQNSCFAQLSIIQYLMETLGVGDCGLLPKLLRNYPKGVKIIPLTDMGVPENWETLALWKK